MEVKKMTANEIVNYTKGVMDNIRRGTEALTRQSIVCIACIIALCEEYGFRISLDEDEYFDYIDSIVKDVKNNDYTIVISSPSNNPPLRILDTFRVLCDNSIHSISFTDKKNEGKYIIYLVKLKANDSIRYKIDYAIRLLD